MSLSRDFMAQVFGAGAQKSTSRRRLFLNRFADNGLWKWRAASFAGNSPQSGDARNSAFHFELN
jgi:hypothetical protein